MANLLCESNINFTASSWKVIDSTSFNNSEASSSNTTTSFVASSTSTPGAITVEGIMIKYRYLVNNTGTLTVELYNSTGAASVAGTSVTINVSDLAIQLLSGNVNTGGFIYLKFSSPVTLLAATLYSVRIKSSVSGSVSINTSTGTNWSIGLVTSTNAAPASSDLLFIAAPFTTTSTPTVITRTFDNTASTVFGSIEVGENNASTAYQFKIANGGLFKCTLNSETEFGTSSSRINASSSFLLELQSTGLASNGLIVKTSAKFTMFGTQKIRKAKLTANSSVGATSLTTNVSTEWKNGDNIVFANTIRSASATALCERKALTADASGTSLTITAMTNAKSGTAPTQCDIGNVTSNAKIYGTSTTSTIYIKVGERITGNISYFNVDNVEFRYLGSGTADKYGITLYGQSSSSVVDIIDCAFHDGVTSNGFYINIPAGLFSDNYTITGNVIYGGSTGLFLGNGTTGTMYDGTKKFNDNLLIGQNGRGIFLAFGSKHNYLFELKNNIVSGATVYSLDLSAIVGLTTEIDGNIIYGSRGWAGIYINISNSTIKNCTSYLNNGVGIYIDRCNKNTLDTGTLFGNSNNNIQISGSDNIIKNYSIQSNSTYTTTYGIFLGVINFVSAINIIFDNCSIGTSTSHTNGVIFVQQEPFLAIFRNCLFGGSSITSPNSSNVGDFSKISFQKFNQTSNSHRVVKDGFGIIYSDTVIYDSFPISQRLTPSSSLRKLKSTTFQIAVASGSTATVSAKVRKSVIGDGTAYNGNQPRLILKANPTAHGSAYNSDIVCATASAAAGTWETLSYTLPSAVTDNVGMEFYVDCDGTTGWVNIDTFVSNNNNSMTYCMNGEPISDITTSSGGETSYVFLS